MFNRTTGQSVCARLCAALGAYKTIQRQRSSVRMRAQQQAVRAVQDLLQNAAVAASVLAATSTGAEEDRRAVERALGKWRGSTVAGYLRGDDTTYLENFRMSKHRFDVLTSLLAGSQLDLSSNRTSFVPRVKGRTTKKATEWRDPPNLRFKLAMCMYALGQSGSTKVKADVGSIGESTLRAWLALFAECVMRHMKPTYMPGGAMNAEKVAAVQGQFASRRGMRRISLACDGSHIPFKPKNKKVADDYRNYKGWHSILAVAFVDSYYSFHELNVGFPGRAGDNTILNRWTYMERLTADPDAMLGPGGVVLGDSGASDGDTVFLNPYYNPTDPDKCWFNFCHSSTRFFVEQTFGMWKSRFRFLLSPMHGANHKLTTKLIYASAILHNFLVVHSQDKIELDITAPCWTRFFETFKAHLCPTCKKEKKSHCVHQAEYRNGVAQANAARKKPSEMRDVMCASLWSEVCSDPSGDAVRSVMAERAERGSALREE